MKYLLLSLILSVSSAMAEVSRSPAVVGGQCDLDIPTTKKLNESKKVFTQEISHKVVVVSDDNSLGCSALPKKQYPNATYEEYARNEMKLLFQKYPENYSKKCADYFLSQGLKKSEYECAEPVILSISFMRFGCEKTQEEGTQKISFAGYTYTSIKYQQTGLKIVEKPIEVVQKEQCARVNECISEATDKELPELKQLAVVACKNELTPVSSGRAPAIEKDSSFFDGRRNAKSDEKKMDSAPKKEESGTIGK